MNEGINIRQPFCRRQWVHGVVVTNRFLSRAQMI
jgi:hypothetical protein